MVIFSRKLIRTEIEYLLNGSSEELASEIFNRLVGVNNSRLFESISHPNTGLYRIMVTALKVRSKLKRWRTLSWFEQIANSILQLSYRIINKIVIIDCLYQ